MKQLLGNVLSGLAGGALVGAVLLFSKSIPREETFYTKTNAPTEQLVIWDDGGVSAFKEHDWETSIIHIRNWQAGARQDGVLVWRPWPVKPVPINQPSKK